MPNTLLNGLKQTANIGYTENGAVKHFTTHSDLLDMYAMGGAYRNRSDDDVILMFRKAYQENPVYALKCLFYLRDVRGGQGERRFFRVAMRDLAINNKSVAERLIEHIPEFGRWDDLYCLVDTPMENEVFALIKKQLALDVQCKTPSLLAKWLKSENTSSPESRALGAKTRKALGMNHKQYRKTLSVLRERINVLERLMSAGEWDKIEFDKIPSKAGLVYRNAFARRDIIKAKYEAFAKDKDTKVNAEVLNPVDIAGKIFRYWGPYGTSDVERAMFQKYWENLKDYYNGREERGIAIVDVSGSMTGTPMNAAVSMGTYIAERGKGPFKDHFITFSHNPKLVKIEGVDIFDKFQRMRSADWGMNTNIEAVFNMLLATAQRTHCPADEMPETLYIFSDMEFDGAMTYGDVQRSYSYGYENRLRDEGGVNTLLEKIAQKWTANGYELPRVIFWNLNARSQNIPALGGRFSYVSGFSMSAIESVLSGKDGYDLMMDTLNRERYAVIQ